MRVAALIHGGARSPGRRRAKNLPNPDEEPTPWLGEFLRSAGFSWVYVIADSTAANLGSSCHVSRAYVMRHGFRVAGPLDYTATVVWLGSIASARCSELDCGNGRFSVNMAKMDT